MQHQGQGFLSPIPVTHEAAEALSSLAQLKSQSGYHDNCCGKGIYRTKTISLKENKKDKRYAAETSKQLSTQWTQVEIEEYGKTVTCALKNRSETLKPEP